jgi:hypothetical protein
MAKADYKELAQCLAFAYFAENPNYTEKVGMEESEHAIGFYRLFMGTTNVQEYRRKYLSAGFPLNGVKKEFKVTLTEKTKKESYHTTAKKVYRVAKACVEKKVFKGSLKDYKFLDQNDPFVLLVKDISLTNIKKAFDLSYKIDILSSVDIMAVKKSKIGAITSDLKKYVTDPESILNNSLSNSPQSNSYANIIRKYFEPRDLIPISLKLPTTISAIPNIKIVDIKLRGEILPDIDPFIKFLALILDEPQHTKRYIDTVIDIDFKSFITFEKLNWELPVKFRYSKLRSSKSQTPMMKYDLNFLLYAQGYGAGWNGQFAASTKHLKDTQWVGGVSSGVFEEICRKYQMYNSMSVKLGKLRRAKFEEVCDRLKVLDPEAFKECSTSYVSAGALTESRDILYKKKKNIKIINFFNKFQKISGLESENFYDTYRMLVVDEVRGYSKKYESTRIAVLSAHYDHAQICFFFIHGGESFQLHFKRKLFITVFGLITKLSHIYFDETDYDKMKNIITNKLGKADPKKIASEFQAAPHLIIS